jgi:hypothetical protein
MAGGPGEENGGATAVVRQLSVQDVRETAGEGDPASSVSTLTLQPGEVTELVVVVSEHGDMQGWVKAKRTADNMEDTIIVDANSQLRTRQVTESTYLRAGQSQREATALPRPTVAFAEDDEEISDTDSEAGETQETVLAEDSEEMTTPELAKKKRTSGGAVAQQPRHVSVRLRAEAEPQKMVDKILNQTIDDITVREVLGLLPDLLREIWDIQHFLTVKASILATQVSEQTLITILDEADILCVGATLNATPQLAKGNMSEATQHLYACAFPMVLGKVENRYQVNMLIDSGSEMCVMSKDLWRHMMRHLPIDTDMSWSVGSANATHN